MPAKRLSMRKIKEVLRLKWVHGLSKRKIAKICSISRPAVDEYLSRAENAGLSWPLPEDMDDDRLERLLFPTTPALEAKDRHIPDWVEVNWELKGKGVTLFLLWQEYCLNHPQGYQYSWFCDRYRQWQGKQDLVMRQNHRAGEKLFVDYAGQTVAVVDPGTGEIREATNLDNEILNTAWELYQGIDFAGRPVRLIGLGVSDWGKGEPMRDLFDDPEGREREERLYATLDDVTEKFGEGKLSLGLKKRD